MAGYTQTDLDNVKAARVNLALGKRVESVTIGNDTFSFAKGVTDRDLARLEGMIAADLDPDFCPIAHARNGGRG